MKDKKYNRLGNKRNSQTDKMKKLKKGTHIGYGDRKALGIKTDWHSFENTGSKKRFQKEEITGTIEGTKNGYAFLIPDDGGEDFFINQSDLSGAISGDKVIAVIKEKTSRRTVAKVEKVVERGIKRIVGTYFADRFGGYVVSDDPKYNTEVNVKRESSGDATTGDKVVLEITDFPKIGCPEGVITSVLGKRFSRKAEIASIAAAYNFTEGFDEAVIKEAEEVSESVKIAVKGRKDFRKDIVVTIDGETAKDYDDAVSVRKTSYGYELDVHIADVTEYVRAKSELDKSALERGTSVYFPETVIPMLPQSLCNDKCSLLPNEDRLTLSCAMKFDKNGNMTGSKIYKSVIRSKARLTYTAVFEELFGYANKNGLETEKGNSPSEKPEVENGGFSEITPDIKEMLINAFDLYMLIKKKRSDRGSIDLDVGDSDIYVKNGKVVVERAKTDFAHGMIEEFMISANEAVAEYAEKNKLPFIYRIHEKPSEEKLAALEAFLNDLSLRCDLSGTVSPKTYRDILKSVENEPIHDLVNKVMLRSMQKAKYSPENSGHFGLSSRCYCHFTSPIRRYPDLYIHRILKKFIDNNEKSGTFSDEQVMFAATAAEKSSKNERNAELAERAADDYYKTVYMSGFIGESFKGIISGVTARGFFVELENTCEGLVKTESLKGKGRFEFDEKSLTLFSGKTRYRIGDEVEITVKDADLMAKKTEFVLKDESIRCKNKKRIVK